MRLEISHSKDDFVKFHDLKSLISSEQFKEVKKDIKRRTNMFEGRRKSYKDRIAGKKAFWEGLVMGVMSSQQNMKFNSAADLAIKKCGKDMDLFLDASRLNEAKSALRQVRFKDKIFSMLELAAEKLNNEWDSIYEELLPLAQNDADIETERACVNFLRREFKGLGPKQSRNTLMYSGLAQNVVPIDSRVLKVLRENIGLENAPRSISDENVYCVFEDFLNDASKSMGYKPYEFDAYLFYIFEKLNNETRRSNRE